MVPVFDEKVRELMRKERKRQLETLMMIPSENYTSAEVRKAVGSWFMHKYAEGYPGKRYYQGMVNADELENLAIERAKKIFDVPYVNVQPYSGSPANAAVYFALMRQGEVLMGLDLPSGGHLTHGWPKITFSGRYFKSVQYTVGKNNRFDFDRIAKLAAQHKPRVIISGTSAYPRRLNFSAFGKIAQSVGAWHVADISHIAGLVAAGVHPAPFSYADVVTSTTHKTLRGPRGALIMVTKRGLRADPELGKKIDRAVFPGLQGGPHLHTIAGIAVALKEARSPAFKKYAALVVKNAQTLAAQLRQYDYRLVTGGTDTHLILVDLRNKGVGGSQAAEWLKSAGIVVNKNTIPFDPGSPANPSGIRLGTPAITTRGMHEGQMRLVADWINQVIVRKGDEKTCRQIAREVRSVCRRFEWE